MSLEEVSFYNTNGDEVNISNIVNQIIDFFQLKYEVGETVITDFNEGSEIRNLIEAFAVGIYALLEEQHEATKIAFIQSSYGMWLDRIGELPFIDLPRLEGSEAEGKVTFTLSEVQNDNYVIPAGTVVMDSTNNIDFVTLADAIVFEGETTVSVACECLTTGIEGNVPAGNIDVIDDATLDTDLISVSNPNAFVGGEDYELDDDYRARLLENVQSEGFGSLPYYKKLCESVDEVHDVLLIDDPDPDYTKKVLVNGYEKPTPDNVVLDVLSELTLVDNHVLGHNFTMGRLYYTNVTLEITLDVVTPVSTTVLTNVITGLFNGGETEEFTFDGLSINESLTKERIMGTLLTFEAITGVTSIKRGGNIEVTTLTPDTNTVLKLVNVYFIQNEV